MNKVIEKEILEIIKSEKNFWNINLDRSLLISTTIDFYKYQSAIEDLGQYVFDNYYGPDNELFLECGHKIHFSLANDYDERMLVYVVLDDKIKEIFAELGIINRVKNLNKAIELARLLDKLNLEFL